MTKPAAPAIALTGVKSSQVSHVGYHAESKTLVVKFHNGGLYHYSGVPADVHAGMLKAESVGKFLGKHIKGKFDYKRQDEKKEKKS